MKRAFNLVVAFFAVLFIATGCSNVEKTVESTSNPIKPSLTYSNLVDKDSQDQLRKYLKKADIADEKIESLLKDINEYNKLVGDKVGLVKTGFKTINSFSPIYEDDKIAEIWQNQGLVGYNCRITTFRLLSDFIKVKNPKIDDTSMLFSDKEAIETSNVIPKEQENNFYSLFSYISTDDTDKVQTHLKAQQDSWRDKGVSFENKNASVISVVFNTNIEEKQDTAQLFIGHIGILLKGDNGEYIFLEKLSFTDPYQMLIFKNKQEVNDYLVTKYDNDTVSKTAPPFIMENANLMKEYRPNLNKYKK
ncbi:DUF4300 family protein [Actinomyces sp. zg-332]|uniref:DUF4300 family protein n=1 Tax=Actinomyces sp. zg-332 TaxID=2708340 RepID=UPI001423E9EA|nr:DUF4300 family protein [Actinomyces sp. zg-332]QPK93995.1 DUF4300 family protein [Actinomyces sp. zg-332]